MPTWSSKTVISRLRAEGWHLVGQQGSHAQFKHPEKPGKVTVPHPKKDLTIKCVRSIYRQAGWPWDS